MMNREEQLSFCKKCVNRQMDLKTGLICAVSGSKADFELECANFTLDETVKETKIAEDNLQQELVAKLPADLVERLRLDQNLPMAVIAGLVTGLVGAVLWSMVTLATNLQIGYMAVAIGFGVGYVVRYFGKGIDSIFGIVGAVISLLSCVLGNVLSIIGFVANSENVSYLDAITQFNYNYLPELMMQTFGVMDVLFYGLAIYEGYRFSFRKFTGEELQQYSTRR